MRLGVVLYRNSTGELERLARSLRAARAEPGSPSFDVAWLDNSPDDGLRRTLAGLGFPDRYAHAGANLGFGAAHDRLMAEAFAEPAVQHYVCVNPDAMVHPRCLAELVAEATRHARPGLIEARQFPNEHPKPYDPRTHKTP
jgi:GT2 family glycosyltransferase